MRFDRFEKRFLAGVFALTVACSSAALNKAEQDALDAAMADAAAKGGVAVLLKPGEAAVISVTDETSPIFGTTVNIPVDAIPRSSDLPLLTIVPAGDRGVLDTGSEAVTAAGPGALITLQELILGTDIGLEAAANVAVPFPATANVTDIVEIGHQLPDEAWELLENQAVDADGNLVSGDTLSFSPFMAVRSVRTAADINPDPGPCYEEYFDADDKKHGHTDYFYDASDRLIRTEGENDADGDLKAPADFANEYFYDGSSEDVTFSTNDSDNDGSADSETRHYTFRNAAGQITGEHTDYGNNGSIEVRTTYEYDSDGNVVREEEESNGTLYVTLFTYDENGYLIESERQNEDGEAQQFIRYTNDAFGLPVVVEYVHADGKTVGQRDELTYDSLGNRLERAENVSATPATTDTDGTPSFQRANYDCWR